MEKIMEQQDREILFARVASNLLRVEKVDEARQICEDGLKQFPTYAPGHFILAKCYLEKKMFDEAKAEFERVLRYDPNHLNAIRELSLIHKNTGLEDVYKDYLLLLISLDPLNEEFREEAIAAGVYKQQESVKEESVKKDGLKPSIPHVDLSQFDNVEDDFETILKGKPHQFNNRGGKEEMISLGSPEEQSEEEQVTEEERQSFKKDLPLDRFEDVKDSDTEDFEDLNELKFSEEEKPSEASQLENWAEKIRDRDTTDVVIDPLGNDSTPAQEIEQVYEKLTIDADAKNADDTASKDDSEFKQPKIVSQTLGEILVSQKKYPEAMHVFETLLKQHPENENIKKKIAYLNRIRSLEK
jgi:tetratricopeptide (TPR) repeat protein